MNSPETWYFLQQGVTMGPMSRPAMDAMVQGGTLTADMLVWPGYGEWIAAAASPLAPRFGGPRAAPVGIPTPPKDRFDFLPKNPKARMAVLAVIVILGIYAIVSGVQQMRGGMGDFFGGGNSSNSSADASINFQGCHGVATSAVQCAFQNTGSVKKRLCMDVVVWCVDGRHVASTCSDRMQPGEPSNKLVDNFKPEVQPNTSCSRMTYENLNAKS